MSREDECLNVRQPRSYSFYVDDFQPRKAQHAVSPWSCCQESTRPASNRQNYFWVWKAPAEIYYWCFTELRVISVLFNVLFQFTTNWMGLQGSGWCSSSQSQVLDGVEVRGSVLVSSWTWFWTNPVTTIKWLHSTSQKKSKSIQIKWPFFCNPID